MKKLLIFALLYLTPLAFSQGISYSNSVTRSGGFPFATVRVCNEPAIGTPCTPLASIFYDPGLTLPIIQPFSADANGNFSFFGAPSTIAVPSTMYHIQITGNGISSYDIGYVFLAGGGGGGGSSLWSALGTPTSNLALSFGTYTTIFTSGDFGSSPVPAVQLHTTTSTSATDTSYELGCDVAASYHNCMYAKIGGFMQFQVANIGGVAHLGTIVMGSALAPANLTTAYGSKAWILSSTPAYNPLTLYHLSTSETGSMLRMHSASASGGAFDFLTACTNASISDGSCSSGNNVYRVHSDGSTYQSGSGNFGATPPTCCNSIFGAAAFNEAGVAGTPTVGQDYCRADSTTHSLKCSYNGAAEAKLPLVSTVNTWTAANSFPTVTFPESSTVGTPATGQDYCRGDSTAHGLKCSFNGAAEFQIQPTPVFMVGTGITAYGAGDLANQVNNAFGVCSLNCTVYIIPGSYSFTGTISMTKPTQSLVSAGSALTTLNYTGSGDAILWQMSPFTTQKAGTLKGFTLTGTASAVNGIHSGSLQASNWEDIVVYGFTNTSGSSGRGILLQNLTGTWTERTMMRGVQIGAAGVGNTVGIELRGITSWPSFARSDLNLTLNVEANQTGFLDGALADIYNSNIILSGNIDAEPASFATVNYLTYQSKFNVLAETVAGTHTNDIHIGSAGCLNVTGNVSMIAPDAPLTNGIVPATVDAGGFYSVYPWADFGYLGSGASGCSGHQLFQTGAQSINADGTIIVAQSVNLQGTVHLSWPNNTNRMQYMDIKVGCAQFDTVCSLTVLGNYAFSGQVVLTNPVIKLNASNVPQLQITVGNRNGISQPIVATWFGTAGLGLDDTALFPGGTVGSTAVASQGITLDTLGNATFSSHLNQSVTKTFAGSCAMVASTTCTFTLTAAFTGTPLTFPSIDAVSTVPATANSAKCSVSGTTVTITAGISNSLTWDCLLIGNPN